MYGMSGYGQAVSYAPSAGYSSFAGGYASSQHYSSPGYSAQSTQQHYTMPENAHFSLAEGFLAENRPLTPIISHMGDVQEIIEQAYEIITGQEFPHDSIKLLVCDEEQFRHIHNSTGSAWSDGIMGFSFNKYGKGVSEIYVKQDHMDRLLLTVGHELGHVLSPTLPNKQDEEAKAHAFSLAWMETIREHDIGGLQPNIMPNPAHNGLHDVAFDYVKHLLNTGASSFDVFKTLSTGLTSIIAQEV